MTSTLHVRAFDVCSAPAFGARTDLTQPVPRQAANAQFSRDAFGRWNGTPAAFGLRTTPVLDAQGDADTLRVSQTADVLMLMVGVGPGGELYVLPTAMAVPAGVHTARFVKVNPDGLPQVVSPWFAVHVPLDAHDVHAPVRAGALAASLDLGSYASCVVLLALPIVAEVSALAPDGAPVLTPIHPITGAVDATLAFAVADHARSFGDTPLVLRHAAIEYFGRLERIVAATGAAVGEDARARFARTHGPALPVVVGELVELVRYRDAMAFELHSIDPLDAPMAITYEYQRTVELGGDVAHVFDDVAPADGPAVVYNVYCDHAYALSADGATWSPPVRHAHLATRARAPLHVRLVEPAAGAATRAPLTLARYVLDADPMTFHLVYERTQTVGVSTFGDAPVAGEPAAVGPFTLFADPHARNALAVVPTGAFLHGDRSIVAPTPLRGACLHIAEARAVRLAPYTGTRPRFESRTTIGGTTLGSGTQDLRFQAPEVHIVATEGRDDGMHITGSMSGGGAPLGAPIDAVVATPATVAVEAVVAPVAAVVVVVPAPSPYSMVPSTWGTMMEMVNAVTGVTTVRLEEAAGVYRIVGTTNPTNPTLYAFGGSLLVRVDTGLGFTLRLDGVQQTLPLTLVRPTTLTYESPSATAGTTPGRIIAVAGATLAALAYAERRTPFFTGSMSLSTGYGSAAQGAWPTNVGWGVEVNSVESEHYVGWKAFSAVGAWISGDNFNGSTPYNGSAYCQITFPIGVTITGFSIKPGTFTSKWLSRSPKTWYIEYYTDATGVWTSVGMYTKTDWVRTVRSQFAVTIAHPASTKWRIRITAVVGSNRDVILEDFILNTRSMT